MILPILAEILLVIATYVFARQFWACFKRDKYLRQVLSNESHLESFISRAVLENPSPEMARFAEQNEVGYSVNIEAVTAADAGSIRAMKGFAAIALLAIAIASYFLGTPYVISNITVLFLASFGPLSQPAKASALHHVLAVALICYKWQSKDPVECEQHFKRALALRHLYNVINRIH